MINKQSMWFLTLFSLVLVLGVYYVTMPSEILSDKNESVSKTVDVKVTEGDILIAMRASRNETIENTKKELETILTKESSSKEEKNKAFEDLKLLNLNVSKETLLEEKLETDYGIKSYIEVNKDNVKVVINSKEHDAKLANNIMRSVQEEFDSKMYITVEFE